MAFIGPFGVLSFTTKANESIDVYAQKKIDELIQSDREDRIQKINQLSADLNQSLTELSDFKNQLDSAQEKDKQTRGAKLTVRNSAAIVAGIGFISTFILQSRGINSSRYILSGGYTISALASLISYLENRSIHFSAKEIEKIKLSIIALEKIVLKEKRSLELEVRLLCMEDGGSLELCSHIIN